MPELRLKPHAETHPDLPTPEKEASKLEAESKLGARLSKPELSAQVDLHNRLNLRMFGETRNTKLVNIFEKIANKFQVFQSHQTIRRPRRQPSADARRSKTQLQNMLRATEIYKRDFSRKYDARRARKRTGKASGRRNSGLREGAEKPKQSPKSLGGPFTPKKSIELFRIYDEEDSRSESDLDQSDESAEEKPLETHRLEQSNEAGKEPPKEKSPKKFEDAQGLLSEKNLGGLTRVPAVNPAKGAGLGAAEVPEHYAGREQIKRGRPAKAAAAL